MSKIWIAPTGKITKGNVLDVAIKPFVRAIQDHDSQLYLKWNPKKLKGWGCWEIRRRNKEKEIVQATPVGEVMILKLDYHENPLVNHVLDCAYLNYDAIRKLKEIDTWTNKDHWFHDMEYKEAQKQKEIKSQAIDELKYNLRYHKSAMRDFMGMVNSGVNPAEVLLASEWVQK